MKIDLHCHIRKVKHDDAVTREVGCEQFVRVNITRKEGWLEHMFDAGHFSLNKL